MVRRKSFNGRLTLSANDQQLDIEVYITAKQEEAKDCRGDKKDSKPVYQKEYGNPYK